MNLKDCRIIELPKIQDPRGNLTFVEGSQHIPFEMRRVFYLYDVPGGFGKSRPCTKNMPTISDCHVRIIRCHPLRRQE